MGEATYLRDALPVLSPVEDGPGDAAGVLALQEERLAFAVLESEDLAVAADVELTLWEGFPVSIARIPLALRFASLLPNCRHRSKAGLPHLDPLSLSLPRHRRR